MKNNFCALFLFVIFGLSNSFAQENITGDSTFVNNWSIEFNMGRSMPLSPFGDNFVYNEGIQRKAFENFNLIKLNTRYMFNSNIGLSLSFFHDKIEGYKRNSNIVFNNKQYSMNLEVVFGLGRLLAIEKIEPNLNFYTHSGFLFSNFLIDTNVDRLSEKSMGYSFGVTPLYRLNDYMSLKADFSLLHNLSQNRTWDGLTRNTGGLDAKSYNYSFGMIFYLDNNRKHADWYVFDKKESYDNGLISLESRMNDIEIMMNDVDKDGVVDYLDIENNTPGGVQVDTRGRFIDLDKNGVPDDMERRKLVNNSDYQSDNDVFLNLLNQGLINIFYDLNEYEPNLSSVNNVYMLLKYLQANNEVKIKLVGFTDSSGTKEFNVSLSEKRVLYVKNFLTQKGINDNRILIEPLGVDSEVYSDNKYSRRVSVYLVN